MLRISRRLATASVAVLAATAPLALPVAQAAEADPPAPVAAASWEDRVGEEVRARLATDGEVPVVVMLEGHQPSTDLAQLRAQAAAAQDAALADIPAGISDVHRFETVPAFTATITLLQTLEQLASHPEVRRIDTLGLPAQPLLSETVPEVGGDVLHAAGRTGEGATVAVLDTGVDTSHPDLSEGVVHEACFDGLDEHCGAPDGADVVVGPGSATDPHGHGTAVAGIITGDGELAAPGMAPDAEIVALKVGEGPDYDPTPHQMASGMRSVLDGLEYLVVNPELDVDVINMSFGAYAPYEGEHCDDVDANLMAAFAQIENLRVAGIVPVAGSGNGFSADQTAAPACFSNVISVGGVDADGTIPVYADTDDNIDVVAPVWSAAPFTFGLDGEPADRQHGVYAMGGTSSASPMAAGCAAILSQLEGATPDAIHEAIATTGTTMVPRGDAEFPLLDCAAAAEAIAGPGSATCVTASNPDHVSAGRATTFWVYAVARGTNDSLGRNSRWVTTSLRQLGPENWERVESC